MTAVGALAWLCLAQAPAPTRVPPTFGVDVEAVELDVSVMQRDRPVTGLTAADFVVLDSGVRQEVELATAGDLPLKLILTLDTSASMAGERLAHLRSGAGALLGGLRTGDRAALVGFSHRVRVLEALHDDLPMARSRLDRLEADGMTALNDGLYASLALAEDAGRCALVLFSDGITDAENGAGDEFGESRLREVLQASLRESADTIIDRIFEAIDEFASGSPQFDDITVLVVRRY